MNVKINETNEVVELTITDTATGTEWTQDLIGNAGALGEREDQINWDDQQGIYTGSAETVYWWRDYINETRATQREVRDLANRTGMSVEDINARIAENTGSDYNDHRQEAIMTLDQIRAEMDF